MSNTEKLVARFRQQHESGAFFGGQLVVKREGKTLVDECAGHAHGLREASGPREAVTPDTMFQVMSASKPVIALAIAMLEDKNELSVDKPIAHYIPGFEQHGKSDITVLDVLHYRSGVLMEDFAHAPDRWTDWNEVVRGMNEDKPRFPRGTLAYQPASFGWILAEVLRRITGMPLDAFLSKHFPPSLHGLHMRYEGPAAETWWQGASPYLLAGVDLSATFEQVNNHVSARTALVPGAGMYSNARALASFYEMLLRGGVTEEGTRLLSESTLARYVSAQTTGTDKNLGVYLRLGRGFSFGWAFPHFYGWWGSSACYGHAGGFSTVAFADPDTRTAIAYVTSSNRGIPDLMKRMLSLSGLARKL